MMGNGKFRITEIAIESIGGKELRTRASKAKDNELYLVWIQKVDRNVAHTISSSVDAKFKNKDGAA